MRFARQLVGVGTFAAFTSISMLSFAQDQSGTSATTTTTTVGEGTAPGALPPPQSFHQPAPPVANTAVATTGVTEQAGVGGTQAYGRAGVLELGGSVGFNTGGGNTFINVSPSVGWFFMDNIEISGIIGMNYHTNSAENGVLLTALVEPSIHIPFSEKMFGFLGVGAGLGYQKASTTGGASTGVGAGFALAPRLGANILIGRSGVLTPAFTFIYTTTEVQSTPSGALVGVTTSFGFNAGYTVMW